eukprot:scaffold43759_cov61-Cyclotella_meneghiniana.AAC.1
MSNSSTSTYATAASQGNANAAGNGTNNTASSTRNGLSDEERRHVQAVREKLSGADGTDSGRTNPNSAPFEGTPANREQGIPLGTRSNLTTTDDCQAVEFSTYAKFLTQVDPDAEVTACEVATIMKNCIETMKPDYKIHIERCVEKPPVEAPGTKGNEKIHGYFVLRLPDYQGLPALIRSRMLRDTIQQVIMQKYHTLLADDSDMPKYTSAIRFKLSPVNSDSCMPLGLIGGLPADTIDDFDSFAKEKLLQDMIDAADICSTGIDGNQASSVFASKDRLLKNLGVILYTTSAVLQNGRNSKEAIAIGYALTEEGEEAARVFADACEGKLLPVFNGITVTFSRFPPKNTRSKRSKEDSVREFVKDHVTKNAANCNKHYRCHTIEGVTEKIWDDDIIDKITSNCNHVVGIVPRLMMGTPPEGQQHLYKMTIFVHKIGATSVKDAKYFKRVLLTDFPTIFPSNTGDDFVTAPSKQTSTGHGNSKQSSTKASSNWDWMDKEFKMSTNADSSIYVIGWGKRGRGSVGITNTWYGPGGCKERVNRVSGAIFRRVANEAEAFEWLNKWYTA